MRFKTMKAMDTALTRKLKIRHRRLMLETRERFEVFGVGVIFGICLGYVFL